jgi:hypothetical protein
MNDVCGTKEERRSRPDVHPDRTRAGDKAVALVATTVVIENRNRLYHASTRYFLILHYLYIRYLQYVLSKPNHIIATKDD